jgi:hypothetical protein
MGIILTCVCFGARSAELGVILAHLGLRLEGSLTCFGVRSAELGERLAYLGLGLDKLEKVFLDLEKIS